MRLDRNKSILTAWCNVSAEAEKTVFPALVQSVQEKPDLIPAWEALLRELGATRLIRLSNRLHSSRSATRAVATSRLAVEDCVVLWQGQRIGRIQTYYKAILPQETQARIAYEIFYHRFRSFLAREYKWVALMESDSHFELFIPAGCQDDMPAVWQAFVTETFGPRALQENFLSLVNTIKLADRGFSALDIPIVSRDQAIYLSAFYLTNLTSLERGDQRRQSEIDQLRCQLRVANEKEAARYERQIAKLEKELVNRQRYAPLYERVAELKAQYPAQMQRIEQVARQFRGPASTQVSKVGDKIGKAIDHLADMLALPDSAFYQLPTLVTAEPPAYAERTGGDDNTRLCYACGRVLPHGEPVFSANKFIFASPAQRPQSAAGQKQPGVCGVCATVSFISPIKVGSGRLIARMQLRDDMLADSRRDGRLLLARADDQLRMFTMGELGLVAGNYALLRASETVGKNLMADRLGGEQYALYKVAVSFVPEVFRLYEVVAVVGDAEITLPSGQLAVLRRLSDVFGLSRRWDDKGQFAAFSRAVRQVQKDELAFAVYELIAAGIAPMGQGLGPERAAALEELRKEHVEWLMMTNVDLAQQYKDIAAMTMLVYPFIDRVRRALHGDPSRQRIEVRKAIDRVDDLPGLMYTIGPLISTYDDHESGAVRAFLNRNADTYFSYDQLLALLAQTTAQPDNRISGRGESIQVTFGDLEAAYDHMTSTRYRTEREWREFIYKVKLSLAARFPQFYEKKDSDKE